MDRMWWFFDIYYEGGYEAISFPQANGEDQLEAIELLTKMIRKKQKRTGIYKRIKKIEVDLRKPLTPEGD